MKRAIPTQAIVFGQNTLVGIDMDALNHLLGQLTAALPDMSIEDLLTSIDTTEQYAACFIPYSDTLECLRILQQYYHTPLVAIIAGAAIASKLNHAGINPAWFSQVIPSTTFDDVHNPHAYSFQQICDGMGVEANQCVLVDDRPAHLAAAASLGMRGILLDRSDVYQQWPGKRILRLQHLPRLLLPGAR